MKMAKLKKIKAKGCPICGKRPSISSIGSCMDIECCVSMVRQKCDYLSIRERETFLTVHDDVYIPRAGLPKEIETKVYNIIVSEWNQRRMLTLSEYQLSWLRSVLECPLHCFICSDGVDVESGVSKKIRNSILRMLK